MTNRTLLLAAACVPLGACSTTTAYDPGRQMAYEQQRLAAIIGTRTAQPLQRCITTTPSMDIKAVGDVIVARYGGRVWVNHPRGSCRQADSGGDLLAMEPDPGGLHCENSVVRVVSSSGFQTGSCSLGPWVPYR